MIFRRRRFSASTGGAPPPPPSTVQSLGWGMVNSPQIAEYKAHRVFANALRGSRGFVAVGSQYGDVAVDANGYPTGAADLGLSGLEGHVSIGDVCDMRWTGAGDLTALSGCTVGPKTTDGTYFYRTMTVTGSSVGLSYSAPMNNLCIKRPGQAYTDVLATDYLADVLAFSGNRHMKNYEVEWPFMEPAVYTLTWDGGGSLSVGAFYGTLSSPTSPSTYTVVQSGGWLNIDSGTVTGLTVARAGHPANTYWTPNPDNIYGYFTEKRVKTWADRQSAAVALKGCFSYSQEQHGFPLEWLVEHDNALHAAPGSQSKRAWYALPYNADDTYITNALTYLRDNLNPAIGIIIEMGNELWNESVYAPAAACRKIAIAEVGLGGSNLDYDGVGNSNFWRYRYIARRTREWGIIAAGVFGGSFGSRCRMAFGYQPGGGNEVYVQSAMAFLRDTFAQPTNTYLHIVSPAVYTNLSTADVQGAADGSAVAALLSTNPTQGTTERIPHVKLAVEIAGANGMKVACYEGGPHTYPIGGLSAGEITRVNTAHTTTAMRTHLVGLFDESRKAGVEEFAYFCAGKAYGTFTTRTILNDSWEWQSQTAGEDDKRLAVLDSMDDERPTSVTANARRHLPGTIDPQQFTYQRYNWLFSGPAWSWVGGPGNLCMGNGTAAAAWLEFGVFVDTAGTYTLVPWIASSGSATFTIRHPNGTMIGQWTVSGTDPSVSAIVAGQSGVSVTLPAGFYGLRLEVTGTMTMIGIKQIVVS